MTPTKRILDIVLALVIGLLLFPVFAALLVVIWVVEGRPLFHVAERMKTPDESFWLWKLRTMHPAENDSGVSGGDKLDRITPIGLVLRKTRLDEVPQLWNVLKGDMSFVGPRPPLRQYVERFPHLYADVLTCRPGITGLATLIYHGHEERLLRRCRTAAETDALYARACVPRKARLDRIYRRHRSFCLDLWVLGLTAKKFLPGLSR